MFSQVGASPNSVSEQWLRSRSWPIETIAQADSGLQIDENGLRHHQGLRSDANVQERTVGTVDLRTGPMGRDSTHQSPVRTLRLKILTGDAPPFPITLKLQQSRIDKF